jgi:hypothetical protein
MLYPIPFHLSVPDKDMCNTDTVVGIRHGCTNEAHQSEHTTPARKRTDFVIPARNRRVTYQSASRPHKLKNEQATSHNASVL